MEVINLETEEEKKEAKVGASLQDFHKRKLIQLIHEYVDIFSWSYQDMSALDIDIVVHKIPLREECLHVKQKLQRTRPNMAFKIKEKVIKKFDACLLDVAKYP